MWFYRGQLLWFSCVLRRKQHAASGVSINKHGYNSMWRIFGWTRCSREWWIMPGDIDPIRRPKTRAPKTRHTTASVEVKLIFVLPSSSMHAWHGTKCYRLMLTTTTPIVSSSIVRLTCHVRADRRGTVWNIAQLEKQHCPPLISVLFSFHGVFRGLYGRVRIYKTRGNEDKGRERAASAESGGEPQRCHFLHCGAQRDSVSAAIYFFNSPLLQTFLHITNGRSAAPQRQQRVLILSSIRRQCVKNSNFIPQLFGKCDSGAKLFSANFQWERWGIIQKLSRAPQKNASWKYAHIPSEI